MIQRWRALGKRWKDFRWGKETVDVEICSHNRSKRRKGRRENERELEEDTKRTKNTKKKRKEMKQILGNGIYCHIHTIFLTLSRILTVNCKLRKNR